MELHSALQKLQQPCVCVCVCDHIFAVSNFIYTARGNLFPKYTSPDRDFLISMIIMIILTIQEGVV